MDADGGCSGGDGDGVGADVRWVGGVDGEGEGGWVEGDGDGRRCDSQSWDHSEGPEQVVGVTDLSGLEVVGRGQGRNQGRRVHVVVDGGGVDPGAHLPHAGVGSEHQLAEVDGEARVRSRA